MKQAITILVVAILFSAVSVRADDTVRALNSVLKLIDQNQIKEASWALKPLQNPEAFAPAMTEYVRGRLALAERKYPEALQHFSNVVVFHNRDPKWMPAATFYEGLVYKKTGYLTAVSNVVEELKLTYPGSEWSRRADELK